MIKPTLHHVNLKTTRLQEMIDWYCVVVGATVNLQSNNIAFISNDRTHHRIALVAVPGLRDDPQKIVHTGIHHTAFEYDSFDDLMCSFARLKQTGIEPETCLNHGVATSLYYSDPDQNMVELQVDNFGNWDTSAEWMRTSEAFRQNPIRSIFRPRPRSYRLQGRCDVRAAAKGHVRRNISPFEAAKPTSTRQRRLRRSLTKKVMMA